MTHLVVPLIELDRRDICQRRVVLFLHRLLRLLAEKSINQYLYPYCSFQALEERRGNHLQNVGFIAEGAPHCVAVVLIFEARKS